MATFVLVPGAWLGSWAWSDVTPMLEAEGHRMVPLTLPGLAERADELSAAEIDASVHVDEVISVLDRLDLSDVVLVVHSYAGVVGTMVADRMPKRLARVVYLATQPVPNGMSLFDLMGAEAESGMRDLAVAAGDPDRLPVIPDELLDLFYPDHGLVEQIGERFRRLATPHPIATQAERVSLTGGKDAVASSVLWCTSDGPTPASDEVAGATVHELPTGHWPMLTHPSLVASALLEITR